MTYFNTRPIELIRVKEKDIDLINGLIWLSDENSDEVNAKFIALLPEDIELIKSEMKRAAMTKTDEAHIRYLQLTGDELRKIYADAVPDNKLIKFSGASNHR